jgi:glycosyltransferase involved in cell wall biosynthesis
MMELSVILPVHNEAGVIARTVDDIDRILTDVKISHEFICVENGSADDSFTVLQTLAEKYPVQVVRSQTGWGNAVRTGISHARGKLTCYMVSDRQVEAKYIVELYKHYKNHMNSNNRYKLFKIWRTSRENSTRLVNSRTYNLISRIMFGIDSQDINATPKLIETALLKSIPLESINIAIDLELLLKLKNNGLSWLEIPAPSGKRDGGKSTTNLKSVWEMVSCMLKFRFGGLS